MRRYRCIVVVFIAIFCQATTGLCGHDGTMAPEAFSFGDSEAPRQFVSLHESRKTRRASVQIRSVEVGVMETLMSPLPGIPTDSDLLGILSDSEWIRSSITLLGHRNLQRHLGSQFKERAAGPLSANDH